MWLKLVLVISWCTIQRVVFADRAPGLEAFQSTEERLRSAQQRAATAANDNRDRVIPVVYRNADPKIIPFPVPFASNLSFTRRQVGFGTAAAASVARYWWRAELQATMATMTKKKT